MPRKQKGNYRRIDVLFDMDDKAQNAAATLFDELWRESGQSVREFVYSLLLAYQQLQDAPDAMTLAREIGQGFVEGMSSGPQSQQVISVDMTPVADAIREFKDAMHKNKPHEHSTDSEAATGTSPFCQAVAEAVGKVSH